MSHVTPMPLTFLLQESLEDLIITTGRYGNRDDFTVVLQETPLISDVSSASVSWKVFFKGVVSLFVHQCFVLVRYSSFFILLWVTLGDKVLSLTLSPQLTQIRMIEEQEHLVRKDHTFW